MVGRVALAAFAALVLAAPLAVADHAQPLFPPDSSQTIRFDHKTGNEWWVEVWVSGDFDHASGVYARAESGTWQPMTLRSWGAWAASFHIPPGERVQFQAYRAGGMSDVWRATSCYFTHPQGMEQCDPGATDPFRVTFRSPSGNAWWFQVFLEANRPVDRAWVVVDDVDGGTWHPLKHESWGGWATSTHIPQGTTVWAHATDGTDMRKSGCWRWTQASPTECPPEAPPGGPGEWMTRFDHAKGNEWWVEARVGPIDPLRVWAQDDGSTTWHELRFREWGTWSGSFHIEPGHPVRFQALLPSGDLHTSCWFTHPQGLAPDGGQLCGPEG